MHKRLPNLNPKLESLNPYPFERLAKLLSTVEPNPEHELLSLAIGEPQHAPPSLVVEALQNNLHLLAKYPATKGDKSLRETQARWLKNRFGLRNINPETQVLPVNGTREALFAIAQTVVSDDADLLVGCPNPFYQIYEGAALLAGATTALMNTDADNGFLPSADAYSDGQWEQMALLYLCTPGNPNGAVMSSADFAPFIEKAIEHNVVIVSDECYSEIYPDEDSPPTGLLAACEALGLHDYRNCLCMHSLSKRSNLPGLRSGFAAGDASLLSAFLRYRGYHGSAMPPHHQVASQVAWNDEKHVQENREFYRAKFAAVGTTLEPTLKLNEPQGGFYYWPETPIDDEIFSQRLYAEESVLVLPGSYLGRDSAAGNPGANRVRIALVAELDHCIEAATRIDRFCRRLSAEADRA